MSRLWLSASLALTLLFSQLQPALLQACSAEDFSVAYNGLTYFTVSSTNNSCICNSYVSTGGTNVHYGPSSFLGGIGASGSPTPVLGSLTVAQGSQFTGFASFNGGMSTTTATVSSSLSVSGTASLSGGLVAPSALFSSGLTVNGAVTTINAGLTVQGATAVQALTATSAAVSGTLSVAGTTTLGVVNTGNAAITGTLSASGLSTLATVNSGSHGITGTLSVSGLATFSGGLNAPSGTFSNGLTVNGAVTTLNAGLTVASGATTVQALNAASASVSGTMSVTGTSNVGVLNSGNHAVTGTLSVTGVSTLAGVNSGNLGVTGTLSVSGTSTLAAVNSGNVGITGTLSVSGLSTMAAVNSGSHGITGTLSVSGLSTLSGGLNAPSGTFSNGLTVNGAVTTLNAGLTVASGTTTVGALSASSASISGTLGVTGTTTMGVLNSGNHGVSGTLTVTGASTLAGVSATSVSSSGAGTFSSVSANVITISGFDFILGSGDQTSRGNTGASRALVKGGGAQLIVNFGNDFAGGTVVGSALTVNGNTNVQGNLLVGGATPGVCGGLTGWYYNLAGFASPPPNNWFPSQPMCTQTDATINNNGAVCPACFATSAGCTSWGATWAGFILAPITGAITISVASDDGCRFWFAGQGPFGNWISRGTTQDNSPAINVVAGQYYPFLLSYFQGGGGWSVILTWSWSGQGNTVIPSSNLCSYTGYLNSGGKSNSLVVQGPILATDVYITGMKAFAHQHPEDPDQHIVYGALEGAESGTYVRGSGRFVAGTLAVELPEHFALTTGESGITAQYGPREPCRGSIWIETATPTRLVMRSTDHAESCLVDYFVQGVRDGFEDHQPIRPKPDGWVDTLADPRLQPKRRRRADPPPSFAVPNATQPAAPAPDANSAKDAAASGLDSPATEVANEAMRELLVLAGFTNQAS